jgi:cytochrome c5
MSAAHPDKTNPEEITMRKLYIGMSTLLLALSSWTAMADSGEAVYDKHCASCHSKNADNTPQLGNAEHWKIRLDYGRKSLVDSIRHGHNVMPAHMDTLSPQEIGAALDYIVGKLGGWPKK